MKKALGGREHSGAECHQSTAFFTIDKIAVKFQCAHMKEEKFFCAFVFNYPLTPKRPIKL